MTAQPPGFTLRCFWASIDLTHPGNLVLLAANLVPLAGVLFWNWDAFLLLMLYWLETAVIAFWTIVRVGTMPAGALGNLEFESGKVTAAPLALAAFFTVHAGIFMGVHFVFLWTLFSGDWSKKVSGLTSFVSIVVIGTGLWVPLLALFVGRGTVALFDAMKPWLRRRFRLAPAREGEGQNESILLGLYIRIVVMQFTIILGAWVAVLLGSVGALVLLVALKTAVDLGFQYIADHVRTSVEKAKAQAKRPPP